MVERALFDLLHAHDCVIVPGWGGFLAQDRSARLDQPHQVVHPPARTIGFNRHLQRNDGLLTDELARRQGLSFAEANAQLDRTVAEWWQRLDGQGRLELRRIGIFHRDAQRNVLFDPEGRTNFLKDAFGLRPVMAIPVLRRAVEHPSVPAATPGSERRVHWSIAAGVAALVTAGLVLAYLGLNRNDGPGLAWFGRPMRTYNTDVRPLVPPASSAAVFALPEGPLGIKAVPLTDGDSVTLTVDLGSAPADTTAVVLRNESPLVLRYHVVGGCFAQPENAEKLFHMLQDKGYPARRLPVYGELHPVAYGSYAERREALEALQSIRHAGGAQAWLLVR